MNVSEDVILPVIGLIGLGDMGSAVGKVLRQNGLTVLSDFSGRSDLSKSKALEAGITDISLSEVISQADVILSIVPPASAFKVAECVSREQPCTVFVDCNAITPQHSVEIGKLFETTSATYIDASIIGPPPTVGKPTIYVSGGNTSQVLQLSQYGLVVQSAGENIGQASALKLLFSGLNKGFNALGMSILVAAEKMALSSQLEGELRARIPALSARLEKQLPYIPLNSARYVDEMEEIASYMASLDLPGGFHEAAALIYGMLAGTPYANEHRETFDDKRTMQDVAKACVAEI